MRKKWIFMAPLALLGIAVFILIGGEIVMHLWNWLTSELFGWRQINFWQAIGVLALCRILFGGFGGRGSMRSGIWGELLSTAARNSGCIGAIVDGAVRDVAKMSAMGFTTFSRGTCLYDSQNRQRVVDGPIQQCRVR